MQAGWYQDSSELTLLRYWDGTHWTLRTRPAESGAAAPASASASVSAPSGTRRPRPVIIVAIVAVVAIAGGAAWWLGRSNGEPTSEAVVAIFTERGATCRETGRSGMSVQELRTIGEAGTVLGWGDAEREQADRLADELAALPDNTRFWSIECTPASPPDPGGYIVVHGSSAAEGRAIVVYQYGTSDVGNEITGIGAVVIPPDASKRTIDWCNAERTVLEASLEVYRGEQGQYPATFAELRQSGQNIAFAEDVEKRWTYAGDLETLEGRKTCAGR